ncbi:MAG TPA: PSD1 and planctomycete cytochrome C domain-containing protein [Planctomycetaceae bacterium]|nr:PSD1 and planctomycete cytochrome C domain-containing protein [Planctomycetaceae bacterium]
MMGKPSVAIVLFFSLLQTSSLFGFESSAAEVDFFEKQVRPVLVEHCQKCHGAAKQWANLRLDSREAMLKGGDNGPAIVPGQPEASLLIRAVRHTDENLKMPENGKLADGQIAALVRWVEQGAVYPGGAIATAQLRDPNHWSFRPPVPQSLPAVKDVAWPQSPIDHFILAKLEAANVAPAAPADKRTLIRRVTFDLTGLPPTQAEIESFLNDQRPEAFAIVVDRLQDSPAYGEHWGRHWLDVARYADSNGLDENIAHGNAWRYRDYVVASINQDKPFDQFVIEQIAGDLLPFNSESQQHSQLIATGFLSIGPKVLAEVDQPKMRMDIVDEQIDAVGRVFLGLTLGCARCHDHKFDPITAGDYYGLAGIFKSTRTMDSYVKVAKWHEHVLPSAEATKLKAAFDADVAARKQSLAEFITKADQAAKAGLAADAAVPEKLETLYPDATKTELAKLREQLAALERDGPNLPTTMGVTDDEIVDVAIHLRGDTQKLGDVVRRRTPGSITGANSPEFPEKSSGRQQLAQWLMDPQHPLTARVLVNRVWRWHFGRGLVRTTDNFGLLGEAPSHPELLDWLAQRFIADGWSLKSLHRLLVNSSSYQQSTVPRSETLEADPENRLLGRFSLRRLSAEEVRDALLMVSGQLDPTIGGSVLKVKNRGYLFDHTSIDLTDYTSNRRSLYLPVIRNHVYDLFQLLDFPDPAVPTGDRSTSTVAPQALLMMNSDFVMQAAERVAMHVVEKHSSNPERLLAVVNAIYGRDATKEEAASHQQFLDRVEKTLIDSETDAAIRTRHAWTILCHTLLASNEFIYVK